MDDEEQASEKDEGGGIPAWVMTFADLMSLLMCFFVLLLSFSEMDVQKFKQIAGSMKIAFGVQREVRAHEIPKGTSIIAKEFSPAKPQPTIINQVRQKTTNENKKKLESSKEGDKKGVAETEADAREIVKLLEKEIKAGTVEVETQGRKIIIRILEKGSFPSGTAKLNIDFLPVLGKIKSALTTVKGQIHVSGHTDDRPIYTARFRSNWELSAARAVSVAHTLMEEEKVKADRFLITGFAEHRPRVANDTEVNRGKNRRVEITVHQSEDKKEDDEDEDAGDDQEPSSETAPSQLQPITLPSKPQA